LTELADLPRSDLDSGIASLHKALLNGINARDQVRPTATKILTLHEIRIHFLDQINFAALSDAADIADLTDNDIAFVRDDYLDSTQTQDSSSSIKAIKIPKSENKNWPNFKSATEKYFGSILGHDKIPLSYIIRENDMNNFDTEYDSRKDKLSSCLNHSGPCYKIDNGTVLSILVQNTKKTEGNNMVTCVTTPVTEEEPERIYSFILRAQLTKNDWRRTLEIYLKHTTYSGPTRKFSFKDYSKLHALAQYQLGQRK